VLAKASAATVPALASSTTVLADARAATVPAYAFLTTVRTLALDLFRCSPRGRPR
jgi:hypothetical protein